MKVRAMASGEPVARIVGDVRKEDARTESLTNQRNESGIASRQTGSSCRAHCSPEKA